MTVNTHNSYSLEEFKQMLKKVSLKATRQRLAVHQAMLKLGHASADMIEEEIRAQGDTKITAATIYNIMSQLALLGFYHSRLSSNNKMYFDINTKEHIHLYDTSNNTYRDIVDEELMELIDSHLSKRHFRGYKVDGIDIQILCHPTKGHKTATVKEEKIKTD